MSLLSTETKITNNKEQLQSLKKDITIAGNELSRLLKEKEQVSLDLLNIRDEIDEISRLVSFAKQELENRKSELDNKEEVLQRSGVELLKQKQEFDSYVDKSQKIIEDNKRSAQQELDTIKDNIANQIAKLESINEIIQSSTSVMNEIVDEEKEMKSRVLELDREFHRKQKDYSDYIDDAHRLLDMKAFELLEMYDKVEQEIEKIEKPLQKLYSENVLLEKKKRNLDILESRLKKRFKQMFPDNKFPI